MKFVIDQQLPPALARWLEDRGHSAEHVFYIGLGDALDGAIWDYAVANDAVVLTKDTDFADRRQSTHGPTIVWLRTRNATTRVLLNTLDARWTEIEASIAGGAAVIEVR